MTKAGMLVLLKYVLEGIPIYWVTMAYIPSGVHEHIQKICFIFLWPRNHDKKTFHWVSWSRLTLPKSTVDGGSSIIYHFRKTCRKNWFGICWALQNCGLLSCIKSIFHLFLFWKSLPDLYPVCVKPYYLPTISLMYGFYAMLRMARMSDLVLIHG